MFSYKIRDNSGVISHTPKLFTPYYGKVLGSSLEKFSYVKQGPRV